MECIFWRHTLQFRIIVIAPIQLNIVNVVFLAHSPIAGTIQSNPTRLPLNMSPKFWSTRIYKRFNRKGGGRIPFRFDLIPFFVRFVHFNSSKCWANEKYTHTQFYNDPLRIWERTIPLRVRCVHEKCTNILRIFFSFHFAINHATFEALCVYCCLA